VGPHMVSEPQIDENRHVVSQQLYIKR
jgi:hypothetical protein